MRGKDDRRELALLAALLLALLLFVAGLCLQPMAESDLFFRVKVGQEILSRHALLETNLFSFTAPDHPDLDLAWGFEVLVALLFRWGGFPAVVVGKTVVVLGAFAGAFVVCRRGGASPWAAAGALALAAAVMRERLVERPHIVSFAGEVAVLALLARLRRGGPWRWRSRLAMAGVLLVWANMHAGVFVAAAMLGLAGAGAIRKAPAMARRAFVWAGAAVVAACVTPVGPGGIARYLLLHLSLPRIHTIDEFRHATWRSDAGVLIWLTVVPLLALLSFRMARTLPARTLLDGGEGPSVARRPDWADVLPVLGVSALGVASVRFSADAALVAAPLAARAMSIVLDRAVARRAGGTPQGAPARVGSTASVVVAVGLLLATVAPRIAEARAGRPFIDVAVDRSDLPLDAIRFAGENGLRDRMYNDFELGSYLLFEGYPRHRVFIDPRLPAYPQDLHRALGRFDHDRASWDALMTRYGVETALLGYAGVNRRVAWWDPERWALIYRAGDARVFVRRAPRWRALIAKREIPVTFAFDVWTGARPLPLLERPADSPVSDCEWQRRLGDLIFDLQGGKTIEARAFYARALAVPGCLATTDEAALAAWMGALELRDRNWGAAFVRLDRALELNAGDTRTRANRATALERLGRRAAAAADWADVATAAAGTELGTAAAARAQELAR